MQTDSERDKSPHPTFSRKKRANKIVTTTGLHVSYFASSISVTFKIVSFYFFQDVLTFSLTSSVTAATSNLLFRTEHSAIVIGMC